MKAGGNAVDAAVATAFANGVVEPFMCGIGGGGAMVIYLATGEAAIVNFCPRAPLKARPDMYEIDTEQAAGWGAYAAVKDNATRIGYKAPLVPGTVAGLSLALERYGTMSLEDVMQPAIKLAEDGYRVDRYVSTYIGNEFRLMSKFPEICRIFLKDGYPPPIGWRLIQKDLAATLKKIAHDGSDGFYKGEIAQVIATHMKENGGLITEEDLANYKPRCMKARPATYRGYDIVHVPGHGGTIMVEILNILEGYDIEKLGHNSAEYIHVLAEAVKFAFTDISTVACGDPDRMPLDKLESKEHAAKLRKQIDLEKASLETRPGDPWLRYKGSNDQNTTHFSVIDRDRSMVSCTFTLGSAFGSKVVIPGTGIVLDCKMSAFNPVPGTSNSIEPGIQRYSSMDPIVVLKNGNPLMALGSPSNPVCALTQVFLNVAEFGMCIQEAIEAPRMGRDASDQDYTLEVVLDDRIPEEVGNALRMKGHEVVFADIDSRAPQFARPSGILIDSKTGTLHGGHHNIVLPYGRALGY
jgi:gamma-glutamyltranspeptidase/glutathione hydrolase